jgi:rubrerythrin
MLRHDNAHIEALNSLLRGELAACETYRQALEELTDEPGAAELRRIEREHEQAVGVFRNFVIEHGADPDNSSGPWGTWAKTVTGTAKAFGVKTAIKALKEGEQHGLKDYEKAAEAEGLDPVVKMKIRDTLIPRQRVHIQTLDRLIEIQRV